MGRLSGKMKPLISVIVPIYQVERYLRQCIDSILNQTYENLDIILVDDGSSDACGAICDEYAERDSRIRVIHKANGGLVSARKAGLKIARGGWVAYVDSDDWIEPTMYEMMWKKAERHHADVVVTAHQESYDGYETVRKNHIPPGVYEEPGIIDEVFGKMLYVDEIGKWGLSPACWDKLLKKEVVEKYQYDVDDRIWDGEDHAFIYSVILEAKRVVVLDEAPYHHRIRSDSVAVGYDTRCFERFSYLFNHLKERFSSSPYWNGVLERQFPFQMRWFLLKHINTELGISNYDEHTMTEAFVFPFSQIEKGSRVVIYGAGKVGVVYYRQLKTTKYCEVCAWVAKDHASCAWPQLVQSPQVIRDLNYDKILIAVKDENVMASIKKNLFDLGVPESKIVWFSPTLEILRSPKTVYLELARKEAIK
jgi:glycosyltransferase involved in cell wall biosynthesis